MGENPESEPRKFMKIHGFPKHFAKSYGGLVLEW